MKTSDIKNLNKRNAVRRFKSAGFSISKIAKELRLSYKHAKQLYEQENVA